MFLIRFIIYLRKNFILFILNICLILIKSILILKNLLNLKAISLVLSSVILLFIIYTFHCLKEVIEFYYINHWLSIKYFSNIQCHFEQINHLEVSYLFYFNFF